MVLPVLLLLGHFFNFQICDSVLGWGVIHGDVVMVVSQRRISCICGTYCTMHTRVHLGQRNRQDGERTSTQSSQRVRSA